MKSFRFDQVFDPNVNQETVYRRTRIDFLVKQVVAGFHATIFAYGQTGSGKTFTMEGYKYKPVPVENSVVKGKSILVPVINQHEVGQNSDGLIPRVIKDLFEQIAVKRNIKGQNKITISAQYIQLYNEKVFDLLNSTSYLTEV